MEGELDKFKIDPQTGEVSTIQVSLSHARVPLIIFNKNYFLFAFTHTAVNEKGRKTRREERHRFIS